MIPGNKGGFNPQKTAPAAIQGGGNEFDCIAHFGSEGQVDSLKPVYASDGNLVEIHRLSKGQTAHNGYLMSRVTSVHVQGRISLGKPIGLGLGECLLICLPLRNHLGKNIVTGAIHNAVDRINFVGNEPVNECPDNRNAPAAACLKCQADGVFPGNGIEFLPVLRQECLVGGYHMFFRPQRLPDKLPRKARASHQLNNRLHLGIFKRHLQISLKQLLRQVEAFRMGEIPINNVLQIQIQPAALPPSRPIIN